MKKKKKEVSSLSRFSPPPLSLSTGEYREEEEERVDFTYLSYVLEIGKDLAILRDYTVYSLYIRRTYSQYSIILQAHR